MPDGDDSVAGGELPFDVDAFLAQPLVARLATSGPAIRPVWFLWEEGSFWWLTGSSYSRLAELLEWDGRFRAALDEDPSTRLVWLTPTVLQAWDRSFRPSA